jgi:hypothetical protein
VVAAGFSLPRFSVNGAERGARRSLVPAVPVPLMEEPARLGGLSEQRDIHE